MSTQIITTKSGERLVVVPESEYNALVRAAEDAADTAAVMRFRERLAAGEEELVPSHIVDRLMNRENPIRIWREYRGMSASDLAEAAGIATPYLSQMETGKRTGTVETLRDIAKALHVTIDDLIQN